MIFLSLGAVAGGVHWAHVRQETALKQTVRELAQQRDSLLAAQARPSVPAGASGEAVSPTDLPANAIINQPEALSGTQETQPTGVETRRNPASQDEPVPAVPGTRQPAAENEETKATRREPSSPNSNREKRRSRPTAEPADPRAPERFAAEGQQRQVRERSPLLNERAERTDFATRRPEASSGDRRAPRSTERVLNRDGNESVLAVPERLVVAEVSPLATRSFSVDSLPEPAARSIPYYEAPQRTAQTPPGRAAGPLRLAGRLGIAGRLASGQRSARVTGEVRLGERFGLLVGVQTEFVAGSRYFTEQDFERINRRDFRRQYIPKLPPRFDILNITETYTLVNVPLRVQYYQPLASAWWAVLGLGTDLDLSVRQRIRYDVYDFRPRPSEFGQGEYRTALAAIPLNNLTVSAGLEKRVGRVGLHLSSSWIVPMKTTSYRRSTTSWGGQVGLSYQLGTRRSARFVPPPS